MAVVVLLLKRLRYIVISCRPRQWLKNLALFAPAYLWGNLFEEAIFGRVVLACLVFCLLSSAGYLFNDVSDREKDARHPLKRLRPVASGELSPGLALAVSAALLALVFPIAFFLSTYLFLMVFSYALLQIVYSMALRNVIIIDALTIAGGFILRVFAGALVIPVPISSWLVLSTIGLSLLLAFGKRRSERTLLSSQEVLSTRGVLRGYPDTLLDSVISTFAAFTILSYSLFAFQTSPTVEIFPGLLPPTLARPKWMMLTIPLVIYGVSRYLYVIYEKKEGESPAEVLLSDRPLLLSIIIWAILVGIITYRLGGY